MRIHALHGIHTSPKSRRLRDMCPYIENGAGIETVYHEYGDILALQTRYLNPRIAEALLDEIEPGDWLLGHSNANPIWLRTLMLGSPAVGMVILNGALKDNIDFAKLAPQLKVIHNYYNAHDEAVPWAKASKWLFLLDPLWGDMGRDGYKGSDKRVTVNLDCGQAPDLPCLKGHSAIIDPANYETWGVGIGKRVRQEIDEATWPGLKAA